VSVFVNNIILIGFMGTGKTTLGRLLAERLQWSFVDCDERIVDRAGMSIADVFTKQGEDAFRALESEVIDDVLRSTQQVVSTGGGSVLRAANRQRMKQGGLVIALTADKATILRRVQGDAARPLLQGDAETRIEQLLEERKGAYDFAHLFIDTAQLTVDQAIERVVRSLDKG